MIIESDLIVANRGNLHIESYTQEAFGNIISSTGYADNDLHLHERGQENGYIDLYYFGGRWYDPELGRWLSSEPLGLDGPNLYHFNFNDPVNGYDPNGLEDHDASNSLFSRAASWILNHLFSHYRDTALAKQEETKMAFANTYDIVSNVPLRKLSYEEFKHLGRPGDNCNVREVFGDADLAYKLFKEQIDSKEIPLRDQTGYYGYDKNGNWYTYRPSSKSGPPTIDVNEKDKRLLKIKFVNQ